MPKFAYRIQDANAQVMEGVLEAASESQAQKFLTERDYDILSLKQFREHHSLQNFLAQFEKVNSVQFNFFVRQMAIMLRAGVPMLPSLMTLQEGVKDPVLRRVIQDIYTDVEKGNSFSQSVARHPKVFTNLFLSTVRSGEAIGELDTILERLADILEKDYQTRSKVKAALRYPIFATGAMVVAFLIATMFIIPRFKSLFDSFATELPLPTRILLGTSDILLNYWYLVAFMALGVAVGIYYHYRTALGRLFWDGLMLRVPIFGEFIRNSIFSRFARMLGLMLKSGVNILQALELIADIVGNRLVADSILRIKEQVAQGDSLANQMRQEGLFPLLLIQIVHVGEESGKVDDLLLQIAGFYDDELEVMTKNMETLIEPIFIVMLAGFVMIMALGIFLPMWNMFSVIQQAAV